jgi:ADP-ribose pyrophosphatase
VEIVKRKTVYDGHYKLKEITLRNGEKEFTKELFDTPDSVCAIVYDTLKRKFIFARQYRVSSEDKMTEIVAGRLDGDGEDKETALLREIEEETGYATDRIKFIAEFYVSPGACSEKTALYYTEVSRKKSEGGGLADENEQIELLEWDREEVKKHKFDDAKSIIAQQWILQQEQFNEKR